MIEQCLSNKNESATVAEKTKILPTKQGINNSAEARRSASGSCQPAMLAHAHLTHIGYEITHANDF